MALTVVTAAMFAGVIAAMYGVIQPMLNGLDFREYTLAMQGIIASGRKAPVIWILLLVPIVTGAITLALLWSQGNAIASLWTLIGLLVFIAGPLLYSRQVVERYYDGVMAWSPRTPTDDWQRARMQWLAHNRVRLLTSAAAAIAFVVALAQAA